jgi:hypothetical protein
MARDRPVNDTEHLRDHLGPCRQQVPKRERQRQHPLANGLLRQDVVHEQCRRFGHPPCAAARAEPEALARESHQLLGLAGIALDPQKAELEQSTLEISLELGVHVPRQWPPLGCPPIPEPGIVLGHELVEQRRFRPVPPISRRRDEIFRLRNVAVRRAHAVRPCTDSTA